MKCYSNNSQYLTEISGLCDKKFLDEITTNIVNDKIISFNKGVYSPTITLPNDYPVIKKLESIRASIKIIRQKVFYTPAIYNNCNIQSPPRTIMNLENKLSTGRALNVIGLFCFSIQYTSCDDIQKVYSFYEDIPFSLNINLLPYANLNDNFQVINCIEDISILNIDLRSIFLSISLVSQAIPSYTDCTYDADLHCCDTNEIPTGGLCNLNDISKFITNDNCQRTWSEFSFSTKFELNKSKPPINKIIKSTSSVEVTSQKVITTPCSKTRNYENNCISGRKLLLQLKFKCKLLYSCDEYENNLFTEQFSIPLSVFIIIHPCTSINERFLIDTCIEDIFLCKIDSYNIYLNSTVFAKAYNCKLK